jgi:hypothetical protein
LANDVHVLTIAGEISSVFSHCAATNGEDRMTKTDGSPGAVDELPVSFAAGGTRASGGGMGK